MVEKIPETEFEARNGAEDIPIAAEDVATIPKGTIDPVYEAKARVLNHAVGSPCTRSMEFVLIIKIDTRDRYGLVSVAAVHCRRLWLGQ
jgi:hypothetical protein